MIDKIYKIEDLNELKEYLSFFSDIDKLRDALFSEFLKYCLYRNALEWNNAVKLCECLAIIGWGDREPVEAIRGQYFNGSPNTYFLTSDSIPRFFDAVWYKGKDGIAIDFELSKFHTSPDVQFMEEMNIEKLSGEIQDVRLNEQRNWIPKNPICITRGLANCYENSKSVIESMEKELRHELNRSMRPELYGNAIDQIIINCSFSFYDNYHCKTNYIIADEALKLRQKDFYPTLLDMFSEKEIEDNGYYLRNRFTYGPFRKDTGTMRIVIVFEREFSELAPPRQKQVLSDYFLHAVRECSKRLSKKVDYNFDLMISDFSSILQAWCDKDSVRI